MKKLFDLVKQAGILALQEQSKMVVQTKTDKSIVTNGDLAVSAFLEQELAKMFPDHSVFSEENTSKKPTSNKVIVIDPIDGTESYSRKQDTWSILIGFLKDGLPVGGVVYQPTKDNLYYAFKGQGAFLQHAGIETQLSAHRSGEVTAVASVANYGEAQWLAQLGITKFIKTYSAALKIMLVAEGKVDVYPNFRHKCSIWDLIAPQAILEEAGGVLIYENPQSIDFNKTHVNQNICAVSSRFSDLKISK